MSEVKATHVSHSVMFDDDDLNKPGDYSFTSAKGRDIAGMAYVCPCGCGSIGHLDFRPHESPSWNWDAKTVSLTPSVRRTAGCMWHGFLTNGVWRSC